MSRFTQALAAFRKRWEAADAAGETGRRVESGMEAALDVVITDEVVADVLKETMQELELLVCTRVWSAWAHQTMTEEDFDNAWESDEIIGELTKAVISKLKSRE